MKIGQNAFQDCTGLKDISLPASIDIVPEKMCWGCTALQQVSLPASVTVVGAWSFRGCKSLKSLSLPAKLRKIEDMAFEGCDSLRHINLKTTTPPATAGNAFDREAENEMNVTVPHGSGSLYILDNYWWRFQRIEELK